MVKRGKQTRWCDVQVVSQPKTPNPNPPPLIQMYPDANEPKEPISSTNPIIATHDCHTSFIQRPCKMRNEFQRVQHFIAEQKSGRGLPEVFWLFATYSWWFRNGCNLRHGSIFRYSLSKKVGQKPTKWPWPLTLKYTFALALWTCGGAL